MAPGQVRLDSEVMAELQLRAKESGRSVAAEANAWLRRALSLEPGIQTAAARAHLMSARIGASPLPGAQARLPRRGLVP